MIPAAIISILLSLGIISDPGQANSLSQEQINQVIVNTDISGI